MDLEALERLARLKDSGALTDEEFQIEKRKLLSALEKHELAENHDPLPLAQPLLQGLQASGSNSTNPSKDTNKAFWLLGGLLALVLLLAFCSAQSASTDESYSAEAQQGFLPPDDAPAAPVPNDQRNPLPDPAGSPTELALFDQISCKSPPAAAVAFQAMLRNKVIRETKDNLDGSIAFVPTSSLRLLGFPVVRLTGWQDRGDGQAMPPFYRGPGTTPPNFISVTVKSGEAEVTQRVREIGISEEAFVPDPSDPGVGIQRQRLMPGISIADGDIDFVASPLKGVTTLTCSADKSDFR